MLRKNIYVGRTYEKMWYDIMDSVPSAERVCVVGGPESSDIFHVWHLCAYGVTLEHVSSSQQGRDFVTIHGTALQIQQVEELLLDRIASWMSDPDDETRC